MSKKVLLILGAAFLAVIAAFFVYKYELSQEVEPDQEEEEEEEEETKQTTVKDEPIKEEKTAGTDKGSDKE